jgi:hypothetical protein
VDTDRLESLARALATERSRRTTLATLFGGLSLLGFADTTAKKGKGKHKKGNKGKHHCAGASAQGNNKGECADCATTEDCPLNTMCLQPQGVCVIGCVDSSHCDATRYCTNGDCQLITPEPDDCDHDSDCPPGQYCNDAFECYTP